MRRLALSLLLLISTAGMSYAQRTIDGQYTVSGESFYTGSSLGGRISVGRYTGLGILNTSIAVANHRLDISDRLVGSKVDALHVYGEVSMMLVLISNRAHSLLLYGGAGAFIGAEALDPFGKLPKDIEVVKPISPIYGISPRVEADVFIGRRMALTVACQAPFNIDMLRFAYELALGFRIAL